MQSRDGYYEEPEGVKKLLIYIIIMKMEKIMMNIMTMTILKTMKVITIILGIILILFQDCECRAEVALSRSDSRHDTSGRERPIYGH